jgi:hypothetical protein
MFALVGAVTGGFIGLGFSPWWVRTLTGVMAGAGYGTALGLVVVRLARWFRSASRELRAGVTIGGVIGAVAMGLAGAVAASVMFPSVPGDTAALLATGAVGFLATGPVGFGLGAVAGGLLIQLYEWLDTRYVTPLRTSSALVDRGTRIGLAVGVCVACALATVCLTRWGKRQDWFVPAGWVFAILIVFVLLGLFWVVRVRAKQHPDAVGADLLWYSGQRPYHKDLVTLALALGFAGGAVGFLVGAVLYTLGVHSPPESGTENTTRRARPGWWRKRPRDR